jgi:hypothetical protein
MYCTRIAVGKENKIGLVSDDAFYMQYVQILKQEIDNLVLSDSLSLKGFFLFCRFTPAWLKSLQNLLVRPMD